MDCLTTCESQAKMLATSHSPPSRDLFQWTDGLRSLLHPYNVNLHLGPGDASSTPIPTNEWWGNLLAWDHHQQRDSDPIFANPYVYHIAQKRGLSVGYLHDYRQDGPINENGAIKYYFYPATVKNVVFSAAEWTSTPSLSLQIESWDDLGLTFQLSGSNTRSPMTSATQGLRGYLSMGNAFTSLEYHGQMHPQIQSDHAILQVNDQVYQDGMVVEGNVFQVLFNNGHRWVFYFFASARSSVMQPKTRIVMHQNVLTTVDAFDGVVQAAYVSSQPSRQQDPDAEPKILALYQAIAGVFPVGADVVTEADRVSFGYEWKLKNVRAASAQPTCSSNTHLHFALPHLQVMMDHTYVIRKTELTLWSHTRGPMTAYILRAGAPAKKWRFTVPSETSVAVDQQATEFLPVNTSVPGHVVDQLKLVDVVTNEILHTDWNKDLPREGSYYFKGKALQKFATMVLVAKRLAMTTSPQLQSVFEQGLDKLRTHLKEFAKNKAAYPLVYDTVYKGIITSEGITKRDYNVDFGNAAYNDHHYHYGYLITATAILLHLDASSTRHHQQDYAELRVFVETLIRDVVNPDASDVYFPRFRLFNWFLGHSYSHGVTPMADGKDEESTSEEINFLYGLALYSRVTQHAPMETLAKLMLKVNAIAIETYFLISDDRIGLIHPASFGKNKVTGICFDNKCDYATWFNPARECIHGIQMIPVSPMLDVVRTREFIKEEWGQILSKLDCVTKWDTHGSGWTSLLYSNAAVLDAELACHVLSSCPVDDGLSRAWALYIAATKLRQ